MDSHGVPPLSQTSQHQQRQPRQADTRSIYNSTARSASEEPPHRVNPSDFAPLSTSSPPEEALESVSRLRSHSPLQALDLSRLSAETDRRWSQASDATLVSSPTGTKFPKSDHSPPMYPPPQRYWHQNPTSYHPPSAYASRLPPRPLIDRVTNEWQTNPKYHDLYQDDHSDDEFGFEMGK
jgi:hypothetical protein